MKKHLLPFYQTLQLPLLGEKQIQVVVKRLDLLHPLIQGNKHYKLLHNIRAAKERGYAKILTFGGAFSNHIHATAISAAQNGLQSIGLIRGEIPRPLNPTLSDAENQGMQLYPMPRTDYRGKQSPLVLEQLRLKFGEVYIIPEGGTNALAIKGSREILDPEDKLMDVVAVPIGTGGTFAGLLASASTNQQVLGFSALKGAFIHQEISKLLEDQQINPSCSWDIHTTYHFGGYGKFKPELIAFIKEIKETCGLPLEPLYTGKMLYGLMDLIRNDAFHKGTRILLIHTGGLQGIRGFNQRFKTDL
ncbi:1-aminocyclopropane-1-carboxylate deaminase/D-cysteine desulfhydrase [Cyclobacterium plantarum]|uniref:1-aminocyclopropane-1-carboxylate deaminase/D-cysteine desulfhydrase n=1 Tax=Cyclobacterium plantarum TaxID=2716263 RepID=A0ABX0H579_9BACT|nr:pyridoxal-phosphate dependent enzyme [Cyclobacterium plantarum]NHE56968.1 1-aminocyclopropane-1-carboxylate deaminase/D-cysteine desulfhydrase [Cyclobacterium plantarum]